MPIGSTWKLIGSMEAGTSTVLVHDVGTTRSELTKGVGKGLGGTNLIIFTSFR